MAYQPTTLLLDDAVLTGCTIHAAGGGLPRRIESEAMTGIAALIADSPSNFWQMDEVAGVVLTDSGSLAQNGVIDSATFSAPGQWPGTYALTTTGSGLAHIANAFRPQPGTPWSIEVSFYGSPFAGTNGRILFANYGPSGAGITLFGDASNTYFAFQDTPGTFDYFSWLTSDTSAAQWNTWCLVCDGNHGYVLYQNGIPLSLTSLGSTLGVTMTYSADLFIGISTSGASPLFAGNIIDWLAYFDNVQLTQQQALDHHAGAVTLAQARWTIPQATGTPVMVCVPGALGRTLVGHPTHTYLSIDGGATRVEVEPDVDVGALTPTGDLVVDVELEDSTTFIGGDAGEGPTLWVDDGVAPGSPPPSAPTGGDAALDPVPDPPRGVEAVWS